MYDLHNHLLPGIDDGAQTIEDAISLARLAFEDGITHMVCTPHIHFGRYENNITSIQKAHHIFSEALIAENIPLKTTYAAEVRIGPEILQMAMSNVLPFLGSYKDKDVLLLEFPSNAVPLGSDKLIKWLVNQNIAPMIAHPERNQVFQDHPERLRSLIELGCLTQVTAAAFNGQFGPDAKESAQHLLRTNQIHIIASDAHNIAYRPPLLSEAFKTVAALSSEATANTLFIENPKSISHSLFQSFSQ